MGYSPVQGKLHTRYAPVRHSSATEVLLPSDLHVLGLPLAFILSQDQTLHRYVFKLGRSSACSVKRPRKSWFWYSKWLVLFVGQHRFQCSPTLSIQYVSELSFTSPKALPALSGCKYKTLFPFPQSFADFFFQKKSPASKCPRKPDDSP